MSDQRTGQADTAPQAHIDAVADALVQSIREHTGITKPDPVMWNYDVVKAAGIESRALLDSTDPAVHAALLDALTRHGVLTEEHEHIWTDPDNGMQVVWHRSPPKSAPLHRRLVTGWEPTP